MKYRSVGSTSLTVSAVGLGCLALSSSYRDTSEAAATAVIHRALELGITHFDTADMYGRGENERLLRRALGPNRETVVIASKFGQIVHDDGSRSINGRPEYVMAACDASLGRLGVDRIDLYYLHRVDPAVPIEETVGAMGALVQAGKVGHLGLSEVSADTIRRAHDAHPITAIQTEYSLWSRFAEEEVLPLCNRLGIGYVAYAPLGRGFLTATIESRADLEPGDRRHRHPRFQDQHLEQNLKLLPSLREVAAARRCLPGQVALAWLLARHEHVLPIPATTNVDHLAENAAAVDVELSTEDIAVLDTAFHADAVTGERYPPGAVRAEDD